MAVLLVFFSREIMAVFGHEFSDGALVLVVLVAGQILNSVTGPLGVMIDMSGRTKFTLLNSALHLALQIGLCFLLIPRYGVLGAAFAKGRLDRLSEVDPIDPGPYNFQVSSFSDEDPQTGRGRGHSSNAVDPVGKSHPLVRFYVLPSPGIIGFWLGLRGDSFFVWIR